MGLTLTFLGSGDAFGSGGRLQTCMLLESDGRRWLLDCGATSLVALRRAGVDPATIDAILISHLHGDHFGGVPFVLLDGQFRRGARPLVIAGPRGVEARWPPRSRRCSRARRGGRDDSRRRSSSGVSVRRLMWRASA
jgi:ribonuclease BN (tRNA processing enzyme)